MEIEEISVPSNKGKGDNGFSFVTQDIKAFYEKLKHLSYLGSHRKNCSVEIGETKILIPKCKDKL